MFVKICHKLLRDMKVEGHKQRVISPNNNRVKGAQAETEETKKTRRMLAIAVRH